MSPDCFFFLFSSSFSRQLLSALAEGTHHKPATCSEVSTIWKCMSKMWGIPPPTNWGLKPPFSTTSQLNGNFISIYLRNETRYKQAQVRWQLGGVSYIVSKRHIKSKTSHDLDHAHGSQFVVTRLILLAPTSAQNLTILSSAIPEKFKGCKILKWITWPGPHPFQWWSAVRRLTFDIACKHTKLDDSSFSRFRDISGGVKFQNASRGSDHAHSGDSWSFGGKCIVSCNLF